MLAAGGGGAEEGGGGLVGALGVGVVVEAELVVGVCVHNSIEGISSGECLSHVVGLADTKRSEDNVVGGRRGTGGGAVAVGS